MKFLIDIGHPAHIHYFKNLCSYFLSNGHEILFTCRDKEITIALLEHYKFKYSSFGKGYKSRIGKLFGLFYFTIRVFFISIKFKPDIYLNASIYSAIVAWIFRKPHISLEDTFNNEQVKLYLPFTSVILTANYNHPDLGKKNIKYNGYQELLYLHTKRFISDPNILKELGIKPRQKYVIVRFVAWNASHDLGHKGMSIEAKFRVIKEFSKYAKVFISSEKELPSDLAPYKFPLEPHRMHHALAYSSLVFGESATMVAEGAVLGIPGIFIDNTGRLYTKELEDKYSLVYNYTESSIDVEKAIIKGSELLQEPNLNIKCQLNRRKMLDDKIDVTAFLIWFVENYPESYRIMKENPDYQYKFK